MHSKPFPTRPHPKDRYMAKIGVHNNMCSLSFRPVPARQSNFSCIGKTSDKIRRFHLHGPY
ncbi:hypothetical protein TRIP_B200293 [uncultured Desulfatiglans sp.]|nr:hypothetical protein TRIP_B200293 [uncultured Desulfatiglans sp.]